MNTIKTYGPRALGVALAVMTFVMLMALTQISAPAQTASAQGGIIAVVPNGWTTETPVAGYHTATPVLTVNAQTPAAMAPDCPTLGDLRLSTGLDWTRIGSEPCGYNYNTADGSYKPVPLLINWMTTTARDDGLIHVKNGDGSFVNSKATTIRWLPKNPGLTSELQTILTKNYAPLAGYSPDLVVCDDCGLQATPATTSTTGAMTATPVATPAALTPPTVVNFNCTTPTPGGFVCNSSDGLPHDFAIPNGWKALSGIPAQWQNSGVISNVTTVSVYPQ